MISRIHQIAVVLASWAFMIATGTVIAGGELPPSKLQPCEPAMSRKPAAKKKIGPPAGNYAVERDSALPVSRRHVGCGFQLYHHYGPTYYYPSTYHRYEGLNPKYYPFYQPRLWPNYRADATRQRGTYCGGSRSGWYWDEYDDWARGGRYEERSE